MRVCRAGGVRELQPSCTTQSTVRCKRSFWLRYVATHIYHSVAPVLHEGQHRLLVFFSSCGSQGCATGVGRAFEVSTSPLSSLPQRPRTGNLPVTYNGQTSSVLQLAGARAQHGARHSHQQLIHSKSWEKVTSAKEL